MKSRITIEVDFENGNDSAIYIKHEPTDDIRDKLVQDFLGKFAGQSNWCRAEFLPDRLRIKPITAQQLPEQVSLMNLMVNKDSKPSSPTPPLPLHKPLDYEIPELLKELKYGRPSKAQHMIDTLIEAWEWMADGRIVICRDADTAKDGSISSGKCVCYIDDRSFKISRQSFGGNIYKHAGIKFSAYDLWLKSEHGDDVLIEANETIYTLDDGDRFYTTKKQINNG